MNITKLGLYIFAVVGAIVLGLFSLLFVHLTGEHYIYLLSPPIAILICLLFFLDKYLFFAVVVVTRASLDPVFDAIKIGSFGLGAAMNAFVILMAIITFANMPKKTNFNIPSINISWAIFLALSLITIFYSPVKLTTIKVALQFVSYGAMFYLGVMLVKTQNDFGKWMSAIIYSSIIPVLYGIYSMVFNGHGYALYIGEGMRLLSTTNHPACLGLYLVVIITVCFYVIKSKDRLINPFVLKVLPFYLLVLIAMLVMTKSRTSWVMCITFFTMYSFIFERKYLIYIFGACVLALLMPEVQDRILDLQKGNDLGVTGYERLNSFAWRLKYWSDAIGWMSPSHYLFGYGLSSFVHYSLDFGMGNAFQRQTTTLPAHSVYVQLFFEMGILGLMSFVAIIMSCLAVLYKDYKFDKVLIFVVIMILLDYFVAGASDNLLDYLSYIWYHWFALGLIIGYINLKRQDAPTKALL